MSRKTIETASIYVKHNSSNTGATDCIKAGMKTLLPRFKELSGNAEDRKSIKSVFQR